LFSSVAGDNRAKCELKGSSENGSESRPQATKRARRGMEKKHGNGTSGTALAVAH